jgi:hypothetical protein
MAHPHLQCCSSTPVPPLIPVCPVARRRLFHRQCPAADVVRPRLPRHPSPPAPPPIPACSAAHPRLLRCPFLPSPPLIPACPTADFRLTCFGPFPPARRLSLLPRCPSLAAHTVCPAAHPRLTRSPSVNDNAISRDSARRRGADSVGAAARYSAARWRRRRLPMRLGFGVPAAHAVAPAHVARRRLYCSSFTVESNGTHTYRCNSDCMYSLLKPVEIIVGKN